jgi:uncharacterized protein YdaU (DUF1376 family)
VADGPSYQKSPAYQYYPDNFEQGTATFTLAEVGAYQRLLNYQWSNGSIPGDSIKALSQILRCTPSTAKSVWNVIAAKFVRAENGEWRNARMERERIKQAEFRDRASQLGKMGSAKRWHKGSDRVPHAFPITAPALGSDSSPSPSSSSSSNTPPKNGGVAPPPTLVKKRKPFNHYEGERIEVPAKWHEDHVRMLGLDDAEAKLHAWYQQLDAQLVRTRQPIGNWFKWLDACYVPWASDLAATDELERFRPKGA